MKPHKIYAEDIEPAALHQFYEAMKLDCVVQGALLPDAHKGYTLPIGAVVSAEGKVFPAWVGYDIGCGLCAVPTSFEKKAVEKSRIEIFQEIYRCIPTGLGAHNTPKYTVPFSHPSTEVVKKIYQEKHGDRQLGTLGSGNHFIEIGYDELDRVWLIIHSGSRGIGHATASHYMRLAAGGGRREWHFGLEVGSQEGQDYIADLEYCLKFALENRLEMMRRLLKALKRHCSGDLNFSDPLWVNRNHNHAEERDGLWIHRKGATHAEKGMLGVVPGNSKTGAFIVRGKGVPESLYSSSHGAGRIMSRSEAKRKFTLSMLEEQLQGVTAKIDASVIDEAPGAYKDIFEVMRLQADLVDVLHHVKPLINAKG